MLTSAERRLRTSADPTIEICGLRISMFFMRVTDLFLAQLTRKQPFRSKAGSPTCAMKLSGADGHWHR
jgi:hypothetical protein